MSIESVIPSNHLMLCHPLLLLPSIFASIRVFSNESVLHIRWPNNWSFSLRISPSNEYSGLISFRMDWLDLLAVQGTLKTLLQHHNSRASVLRCSAFLIVQLSHPYITTGKTIPLTRQTFFGKVMSLLFNMPSRMVISFLPRSAGSELRPWQRSWGRRLGIRKGGIEPQESPWKFSSIYPQNQSLPTFCFVLSPTPLTLRGALPHYLSLKKELAYSST